jgi:hypothetical protein
MKKTLHNPDRTDMNAAIDAEDAMVRQSGNAQFFVDKLSDECKKQVGAALEVYSDLLEKAGVERKELSEERVCEAVAVLLKRKGSKTFVEHYKDSVLAVIPCGLDFEQYKKLGLEYFDDDFFENYSNEQLFGRQDVTSFRVEIIPTERIFIGTSDERTRQIKGGDRQEETEKLTCGNLLTAIAYQKMRLVQGKSPNCIFIMDTLPSVFGTDGRKYCPCVCVDSSDGVDVHARCVVVASWTFGALGEDFTI